MIAPSGDQITIAVGDQPAVIVEVAVGYAHTGERPDLVDGYGADEMNFSGGSSAIPWPNRLEAANSTASTINPQ
jgi:hypothetical protein